MATLEDYLEEQYYLFHANGTGVYYYDEYYTSPFTYILSGKMLIISDANSKIPAYKITSISKDQLVLEEIEGYRFTEYLERVD